MVARLYKHQTGVVEYDFIDESACQSSIVEARRAVLWPAMQHLGHVRFTILDSVHTILKAWRSVVSRLDLTYGVYNVAMNCQPSMIRCTNPVSPVCHNWSLCPWCSGRNAQTLGQVMGLDDPEIMQSIVQDNSITTYWYSGTVTAPGSGSAEDIANLRDILIRERDLCQCLRMANEKRGLRGFYWQQCLGFQTTRGDDGQPVPHLTSWDVQTRCLAVHQRDRTLIGAAPEWCKQTIRTADQKHIANIVKFVNNYRSESLTTETELLNAAMAARKGLRLANFSGILRANKRNLNEEPTE